MQTKADAGFELVTFINAMRCSTTCANCQWLRILLLQIFLAETKVVKTMEKQEKFVRTKSDLTEKLQKTAEKREQLDAAAREASAELDLVTNFSRTRELKFLRKAMWCHS